MVRGGGNSLSVSGTEGKGRGVDMDRVQYNTLIDTGVSFFFRGHFVAIQK